MELKEEYKYIDFELKMNKRIKEKFTKDTTLNYNIFVEEYNAKLEKAKQNNWLDTYKILSILVEKLNIRYTLLQVKDEIFENTSLSYVWLVLNDEGDIANNIHFRFELKKEYETRISNGILKYDKAIIEVEKKYQKEVESTLDSICSNWNAQIYIRYIENKNVLGTLAEGILNKEYTDEYIDLVKDSAMYKAFKNIEENKKKEQI